jgi:hypothetical protein
MTIAVIDVSNKHVILSGAPGTIARYETYYAGAESKDDFAARDILGLGLVDAAEYGR